MSYLKPRLNTTFLEESVNMIGQQMLVLPESIDNTKSRKGDWPVVERTAKSFFFESSEELKCYLDEERSAETLLTVSSSLLPRRPSFILIQVVFRCLHQTGLPGFEIPLCLPFLRDNHVLQSVRVLPAFGLLFMSSTMGGHSTCSYPWTIQ